ncbi:hypothetical protein [Sedimentitalea todarodis]|uniref:Roadblock/LAMTOR2 domain-containing protein n=1 Tax=Sedimentitalea todarodis TaxID=1631240 RepID=A0ABU3VHS0_9RHOB|nr:hypothetical protein [Sedimentitalea todarodis]MDU9005733.1 hypothetical protein [Sedimentitalea todarodis]
MTRAIKGAVNADMEVGAAFIDREGNILVIAKGEAIPTAKSNIDKMLGIT